MSVALQPAAQDAEDLCAEGTLSVKDAMAFTGLSRAELYRRMKRRELAFLNAGRRRLIPRRALVEFLARELEDSP